MRTYLGYVVVPVLTTVTLVASAALLVRAFVGSMRASRWIAVEARVLSVQDAMWASLGLSFVGRDATGIRVRYEYVVGGQRYESDRVSPFDILGVFCPLGDKYGDVANAIPIPTPDGIDTRITAYYNPSNPRQAYLVRSLSGAVTLSYACTVLLCAGMMAWFLPRLNDQHAHVQSSSHSTSSAGQGVTAGVATLSGAALRYPASGDETPADCTESRTAAAS